HPHLTRIVTRPAGRCKLTAWPPPRRSSHPESEALGPAKVAEPSTAKRPPAHCTGGLAASHSSRLRELAGLDEVNEHVPLVLGENREVPGLTDPDLFSRELNFRAGTAADGAKQYFTVVQ